MAKKIVIIGGVAGGATCAARLRRLSENDEIVLFEKGEHISFANCGLPYFVGDVIESRGELLLQTPETFNRRFNVDVRIKSEVLSFNLESKTISVQNHTTGEKYEEPYDYLVLSPGAKPFVPPIPGVEDERVLTLRNVPDAEKIKSLVFDKGIKSAVIVGGGFIGLETAENLIENGVDVTIVEKMDQIMPNLDADIANIITRYMKSHGVKIILGDGITGFKSGDKIVAELESGKTIDADIAVLAIGVRPDTKFVADSGIEVERNGAIKVDNQMKTNDPSVFAVGDAIITDNPMTGTRWTVALAGPANRQARLVADVINGMDVKYKGTIGTSVLKVFDMTVASTGCSEKCLKQNSIKYEKSFTHSLSNASYYPGANMITTKLIFDPDTGKLFGAQVIGAKGVDKRIDVIATALGLGQTVSDLTTIELAYAPPFGSAKDPVNIAGYTAENIVLGNVDVCHWHDVSGFVDSPDQYFMLDVRTPAEFNSGTIDSSVNIPVDEVRDRLSEIPKDKTIISFCRVGLRGYIAARILKQNGYEVKNLSGGFITLEQSIK